MCEVCQSTPCRSGCPNSPEPPRVYECDDCQEDIVAGQDFVVFDHNGEKLRFCNNGCAEEWLKGQLYTKTAERKPEVEDDGEY
jgi:ribosomal protein L24E